ALPVAAALGRAGLAIVFVSFFAATFAAAPESALSSGYSVAQYMGWSWGRRHPLGAAARFHLVCLASVIAATALTLTTIDPVTVGRGRVHRQRPAAGPRAHRLPRDARGPRR